MDPAKNQDVSIEDQLRQAEIAYLETRLTILRSVDDTPEPVSIPNNVLPHPELTRQEKIKADRERLGIGVCFRRRSEYGFSYPRWGGAAIARGICYAEGVWWHSHENPLPDCSIYFGENERKTNGDPRCYVGGSFVQNIRQWIRALAKVWTGEPPTMEYLAELSGYGWSYFRSHFLMATMDRSWEKISGTNTYRPVK